MTLVGTHERLMEAFEKQRGVELPRLQEELAHARAEPSCASNDRRIKDLERSIERIMSREDEHNYLLEFGAWCFHSSLASPQASKPRPTNMPPPATEVSLPQKKMGCTSASIEDININNSIPSSPVISPPHGQFNCPASTDLTCVLEIQWEQSHGRPPAQETTTTTVVVTQVSAWADRDLLCRTVLVNLTHQPAKGAYQYITVNDQELEDGVTLCDIKSLKLGSDAGCQSAWSSSAQPASPANQKGHHAASNKLRFALKQTQVSWRLPVFSGAGSERVGVELLPMAAAATALADGLLVLPDWATENDIATWLNRPAGHDAFFLLPADVRVAKDVGQAMALAGQRGLAVDKLVRVDRIVSRRRRNHSSPSSSSTTATTTTGGTLDQFVLQKDGDRKEEVFMQYISMLDKLRLNTGTQAIQEANMASKRKLSSIEVAPSTSRTHGENGYHSKRKRRRTNASLGDIQLRAELSASRAAQASQLCAVVHHDNGGEHRELQPLPPQPSGDADGANCCPWCGSDLMYVRREGASVCRGFEEECVDCEGNVEIIARPCGYSVTDIDSGLTGPPGSCASTAVASGANTSAANLSHTTYKRMYVLPTFLFHCFLFRFASSSSSSSSSA